MKILLIGGTGTISGAVARLLAKQGEDLTLLNRGSRPGEVPAGARAIGCDVRDEEKTKEALEGLEFDVVCQFVGFEKAHVRQDVRLFAGKTKQYIYISSASAYEKPVQSLPIREDTPLCNPYWAYSRGKIDCEEYLMEQYRETGFPVTIVRPSHTYGERTLPLGVHGKNGSWQNLRRMLDGKPVLIHGDGTSLWTVTWNEDFARGFVGLLGNPAAIGEAFHITSDESVTWNQIYAAAAEILGVEGKACHVSAELLARLHPPYDCRGSLLGDKANTVIFDNSKLKQAVPGFSARVSMREGLERSIRYHLAHPELQRPDPEYDAWCDRVVAANEQLIRNF